MPAVPANAETPPITGSCKRHAPATLRNRGPILEVLKAVLPEAGDVLEVGAGTGEHAVYFAASLPAIRWQPTDPDPEALASITAYAADASLANLPPPLQLDARARPWPSMADVMFDAVVAINVIHISPWETCCGLITGAVAALKPGGLLYLYGPYKRDGRHTAPSNAQFDQQLRQTNSAWGVRDLADVLALAADAGLTLDREVAMPANNLSVVLRK